MARPRLLLAKEEELSPSVHHSNKQALIIGLCIAAGLAAVIILISIILVLYFRYKSHKTTPLDHPTPLNPFVRIRRFSYRELKAATAGFSSARKLGQGGFGCVYKGILPNGQFVAVKKLDASSIQGEREFQNELSIMQRIGTSKFVVGLIGFCSSEDSNGKKLLVYEYMDRRSLQELLFDVGDLYQALNWETRFGIMLDLAQALDFLHSKCDPPVIHCDVKPSNVLLDQGLNAKIADFGLARLKTEQSGEETDSGWIEQEKIRIAKERERRKRQKLAARRKKAREARERQKELESRANNPEHGPDHDNKGLQNENLGPDHEKIASHNTEKLVPDLEKGSETAKSPISDASQQENLKNQIVFADNFSFKEGASETSFAFDEDDEQSKASPLDLASAAEMTPQSDKIKDPACNSGSIRRSVSIDWWAKKIDGQGAESRKDYTVDWLASQVTAGRSNSRDWTPRQSIASICKEEAEEIENSRKKRRIRPFSCFKSDRKKKKNEPKRWWTDESLPKKKKKDLGGSDLKNRESLNWPSFDFSQMEEKGRDFSQKTDLGSTDLSEESIKKRERSFSIDESSKGASSTPSMRGTVCYVAPEYGGGGILTEKSDVYSFGVVLLVIISGRRPLQVVASSRIEFERANLISWARQLNQSGNILDLVDPALQNCFSKEQVSLCINLALLCLHRLPQVRPSMAEIIKILSGESQIPSSPFEFSPSPTCSNYTASSASNFGFQT